MENRYKITYDLKQRVITNIRFKQGDVDSSVLEVSLIDNAVSVDITGEVIEFRFLKSDNTVVYQDSSTGVSIIDAAKGKVECVLKSNTLAAAGVVKCELHRTKDGKELTTPSFYFAVESSIGEDGILSTNYIKLIEDKVTVWQAEIDAVKKAYDDSTKANTSTEVTAARHDNINNKDYANLGARLDSHDSSLNDIVTNVKIFGAKGNGIADDTVAITNAINYCQQNNKPLYFPSGTYNDSLQRDFTCSVKGENQYSTKWVYTGGNGTFITISSYYDKNTSIKDITLQLGDYTKNVTGLKVMYSNSNVSAWGGSLKAENVTIDGFTDRGVYLSDTFNCQFNKMLVKGEKTKTKLLVVEAVNSFPNCNTFISCNFFNGRIGMQLLGCADIKFTSCVYENITLLLNAVKLTVQPDALFEKCWFEMLSSPSIVNAKIDETTLLPLVSTQGFCSLSTLRFNNNWVASVATPILQTELNPNYEGVSYNYSLQNGSSRIVSDKTENDLTFYVSPTGNDSNNGITVSTPFRTIARAIYMIPQIVNHAVTINLANGTYNEQLILSGYSGKGNITVTGGADLASAVNYSIQSAIVENCAIKVSIYGVNATTTSICFNIKNSINIYFRYCTSTVTSSSNGFQTVNSLVYIINCSMSNKAYVVYADSMSTVMSRDWTTGSGNGVGLMASLGSTIAKFNTQPQGATPETTTAGGAIR